MRVTYVVRLDGAVVHTPSGRAEFTFQGIAELFALSRSVTPYAGRILTVHDGDAATEENVVAVFRDGKMIGPTHEDNGY